MHIRGTYEMTAGTMDLSTHYSYGLWVGDSYFPDLPGVMTIGEDASITAGNVNVGGGSAGLLQINGGSLSSSRDISVAANHGDLGHLQFNSGNVHALNLNVGWTSNWTGLVDQHDGVMTIDNEMNIGGFSDETNGTFNLHGGELTVGGTTIIGGWTFDSSPNRIGTGRLSIYGGKASFNTLLIDDNDNKIGSGTLHIDNPAAQITVSEALLLGTKAVL